MRSAQAPSLSRAVAWLLVSHLATVLVGFTTSIVVAQVGAEELGRWRFAQATVMYLIVGTDAGLTMLAVREIARRRADLDRYVGPVLLIRLGLAVVTIAVALTVVRPWSRDGAGWFYTAMILTIVPAALSLAHVAQGLERMRAYAAFRFVSGAVAASIGLVAFLITRDLIALVIPVIVVGLAAAVGLAAYLRTSLRLEFRVGSPEVWRQLLLAAFPFLVGALAIQLISNADAVIIGTALGERELGLYAAAYVLAGQLLLLSGPIALPIYPRLAGLHEQGAGFDWAVRELTGVLGFFVVPACVGLALLAPSVIPAVYGEEYSRSVVLLTILAGVPLVGFYNAVVGQALNAARLQGTTARVAVLAAAVSVVLNIILVPTVGLTAAAAVAVLTELVVATVYTRALRPLAGIDPIRSYFATVDAVVVMAAVIVATSGLDLVPRVLAGMAAYGLIVMVRRPASLSTIRRFLSG